MESPLIFHGTIIHSLAPTKLEILPSAALVIDPNGTITHLYKDISPTDPALQLPNAKFHRLPPGNFLIPGFVDTHNHAPQWSMRGLGQGLHILDWLDQVTFPHEAKFEDVEYAGRVYDSCVEGFLNQGVTTASYYGSKHGEATKILADICKEKGQRALIGKCNMDRNAPDYLRDASAQASLAETRDFIAHVRKIDPAGKLIRSVLTPRFAICCTSELLEGLGKLAAEDKTLAIQTHFNEAEQEIKATRELFPEFKSEADLYEHFGLMDDRSILAHCTHMTDYDIQRLRDLHCGVAHCPISNMTVGGGFMAAPIRRFLNEGIKVGLGTDSGGGFSSSILDAMRQALIASNAREVLSQGKDKSLSLEEVFWMGTLGAAQVCRLGETTGSFAVGKEFDAVWVNGLGDRGGSMTILEEEDMTKGGVRRVWEKFVMTGDDRNMQKVYVGGRLVKG